MPRIQLLLYRDPGAAEVFFVLRRRDGGYERLAAKVDTGAAVSLLPANLLKDLDYRLSQRGKIEVLQAGIARQVFKATEAFVWLFLEDIVGTRSQEVEVRVWFVETKERLVGFDGILDRATLFIDTRVSQIGWIELD